MNFLEAAEYMKKGKQIKRKGGFQILDKDNKFHIGEILATDWEVVEEPKQTLYDKISTTSGYKYLTPDDVKEALKEFIEFINITIGDSHNSINQKAKEIFGEEMLK